MKPQGIVWVLVVLAGMAVQVFPQQLIQTNARGGIFSGDQKLIFALPQPGWLRLLINDTEIYWGRGPAYPELGVPRGEERSFFLTANYYSLDMVLLESLSWYIFIDKKPPEFPDMELRSTGEGLRLALSESGVKLRAWADLEGGLAFFPDLAEAEVFPADSFYALVWAEDLAGNSSEPRAVFFEIPTVKIENPVPGEWLNRQMLVITGAEGKRVYWTADGSDPLGGTGRLYSGPQRIDRDGPVSLRVAWRDSAGRVREYRIDYTVAGSDVSDAGLFPFSMIEGTEIRYPVALPVPDSWLWSMGGLPRHEGGGSITLRPERLAERAVALHLSAGAGGGIYRFAYLLDGRPAGARSGTMTGAASDGFLFTGDAGGIAPLSLVSVGRSRVIRWPEDLGDIFFSWEGSGPWQKGRAPFPVPLEGGTLQWFALNGEAESGPAGPHSVTIGPVVDDREEGEAALRGRIAFRHYGGGPGWRFASGLLAFAPGMVKGGLEVCDGEDIEWAFISADGAILERARQDRLPPGAPRLAAFPGGGWARGPVTVSALAEEAEALAFITAWLQYASGGIRVLRGVGSLDLALSLDEAAEVTVEAYLVDFAGNRGPTAGMRLIIDPQTVYVSPHPLLAQAVVGPQGGMDNPFVCLREALDYAADRNIEDVLIAGTLELREPVVVSGTMRIEGGWMPGGREAVLILGDDFFWDVKDGATLTLSGIRAERENGDAPLIRVRSGGTLDVVDAVFTHTGPFLAVDGGLSEIRNTRIYTRISGDRRIAAITARESEVRISGSRVQLEGNYALVFDLGGGTFSASGSVFLCAGRRTATVFALNGTRGAFENLTLSAAARDYASVLEAFRSDLALSGGTVGVSARDASAFLLDNSAASFAGAAFFVEGAFTARAFEIRGLFPIVANSRFYSTGSARHSEVFSRAEAAGIPFGLLTGNSFSGFSRIHRGLGGIAFD